MKKVIIMLSAKRCGSTAIFNLFQKHADIKILHKNQKIINWEPQFWLYASRAIKGDFKNFNDRLYETLGFEKNSLKNEYDEESIFNLFDNILDKFGPVIFDKSPQYLGSKESINLLLKYKNNRPKINFIFFAFIRNPLDAITSQHELWKHYTKESSLLEREKNWLKKYDHLEELQKLLDIKLYKYEDFCQLPKKNTKDLMNYCELSYSKILHAHIKLKSLGRYSITPFISIKNWKISNNLLQHMKKYNYSANKQNIKITEKIRIFLTSIKRIFAPLYQKFFR